MAEKINTRVYKFILFIFSNLVSTIKIRCTSLCTLKKLGVQICTLFLKIGCKNLYTSNFCQSVTVYKFVQPVEITNDQYVKINVIEISQNVV